MTEKSFMTVEEVAAELRVSKSKAYQIVRELNAEMQKQGYLTVAGRVNATFFHNIGTISEKIMSSTSLRMDKGAAVFACPMDCRKIAHTFCTQVKIIKER